MKKFFVRLLSVPLLVVVSMIATYIVAIFIWQGDAAEAYMLRPDQDVLFVGASQIGCGIVEGQRYHNKKIWIATSTFPFAVQVMKEFERRGSIGQIKTVVVNFNSQTFQQMQEKWIQQVTYKSLPICWRYFDDYVGSKWKFLNYVLHNLGNVRHFTFIDGGLLDEKSGLSISLSERPAEWKNRFYKRMEHERNRNYDGNVAEWERKLKASIVEMKKICDRHGIRLVAVSMPLLPHCESLFPDEDKRKVKVYEAFLQEHGIEFVRLKQRDECDMYDGCHPTVMGAKLITDEIYEKLGLPIVDKESPER